MRLLRGSVIPQRHPLQGPGRPAPPQHQPSREAVGATEWMSPLTGFTLQALPSISKPHTGLKKHQRAFSQLLLQVQICP